MHRHPLIIGLHTCIQKYLLWYFFPINILISLGICLTPKLLKYTTLLPLTYNAIQWVPYDSYSSRFITSPPSFILGKLFQDWTPSNLGSFWLYFYLSWLVKG